MPQEALKKLVIGHHLTSDEATRLANLVMDGNATPAQIGTLLTALRMKGETVVEIAAFAQAMRSRVVPVRPQRTPLLDTCGTGGSAFRVFNVSTASAFVAAAAGLAVAKHGNRAMSGVCGSADVLEALDVRVLLTPEQVAACIDAVGIGFLFAQSHHPAMKYVGPARREVGFRTLFNLLGPLSNPAGATRQTMGVYAEELCSLAAGALQTLGSERAIVMHGLVGLDEISTLGQTRICELREGQIVAYLLSPADLGFTGPEPNPADLSPAPTPQENALLLREVLTGSIDSPDVIARRNLVAANAAAALRVSGQAEAWPEAVGMAQQILLSGKALSVLDRLIAFTQSLA